MRPYPLSAALALVLALTACGYKTPLTLPAAKSDAAASKPASVPESASTSAK